MLPTTIMPRKLVTLLKIWCSTAVICNHYYMAVIVCYVCTHNQSKWVVSNFLIHFTSVVSFYVIAYRRRRIQKLVEEAYHQATRLDPTIEIRRYWSRKIKLVLTILMVYLTMIMVIFFAFNVFHIHKIRKNSSWYKSFCLGLCSDKYFRQFAYIALAFDGIMFIPIINGSIILGALFYCFVADILRHIVKSINSTLIDQNDMEIVKSITRAKKELTKLQRLINNINKELSYVVLFWFLTGFVLACHGTLKFLTRININHNPYLVAFDFFYHFQLLAMVSLVIFIGSKIPEELDQSLVTLHALADGPAAGMGASTEFRNLYFQLTNPKIALRAGNCFNITSKLFLSYLGFGFTYALIFIQIDPAALYALKYIAGNATFAGD